MTISNLPKFNVDVHGNILFPLSLRIITAPAEKRGSGATNGYLVQAYLEDFLNRVRYLVIWRERSNLRTKTAGFDLGNLDYRHQIPSPFAGAERKKWIVPERESELREVEAISKVLHKPHRRNALESNRL